MIDKRKMLIRSVSLHDRVVKSDVEDKSISNDEISLPTCPRQPPDGVETPCDAVEKIPDLPTRLPPKLPLGWPTTRTRYSYSSRTQDARSEASVKDKIAMFSNEDASSRSTDRLNNCGTLPTKKSPTSKRPSLIYSQSFSDGSPLDRRLTKSQDNLDKAPFSCNRRSNRLEIMGAIDSVVTNSNLSKMNNKGKLNVESKPLFYGSTNTLPSPVKTSGGQHIYHVRSVSDDGGNKNVHRSNLEYLIEQRKKSMSKLRGLVIPETQSPIIDLPEIKIQDSISKSFLVQSNHNKLNSKGSKNNNFSSSISNEKKWKTNILPNNIPKYSPAFKRKSLQLYTPFSPASELTSLSKYSEKNDGFKTTNNQLNSGITNSFDTKGNKRFSYSTVPKQSVTHSIQSTNYKAVLADVRRDYNNVEIKICTATDVIDSDNESAMSSTQSSYRSSASSPLHNLDSIESDTSRISPKISRYTSSQVKTEDSNKLSTTENNYEGYKRGICRSMSSDTNVSLSSSAGSAVTSGSQASCSSLESCVAESVKRKYTKTYSIDTLNRRNIVASAKCRSGRDENAKSPVFENKFGYDSDSKSQSPYKTSERLSTLTPLVSAISIKGENRRRNKIITGVDSDSDSEINVRQRKLEFKNTRLKRNSNLTSKNKSNDLNIEDSKVEDTPKIITEKNIKEIQIAGLEELSQEKNNKTKDESARDELITKDNKSSKALQQTKENTSTNTLNNSLDISPSSSIAINCKKIVNTDKIDNNFTKESQIDTLTIRLKRGAGTGVGLILAGGIDCEAKDVTVHRVLSDSIAAKAGLKRGSKVISINGCSMNGLTHAQSVAILKEQRSEVAIEIENETQCGGARSIGCGSEKTVPNKDDKQEKGSLVKTNDATVTVVLEKTGAGSGLGFGLDGGRDSPYGDRPLTIKKLFAGGVASQSGRIIVGAELISAGAQTMEGFTRTQAWAALKSLPSGPVVLVLRNPVE